MTGKNLLKLDEKQKSCTPLFYFKSSFLLMCLLMCLMTCPANDLYNVHSFQVIFKPYKEEEHVTIWCQIVSREKNSTA